MGAMVLGYSKLQSQFIEVSECGKSVDLNLNVNNRYLKCTEFDNSL